MLLIGAKAAAAAKDYSQSNEWLQKARLQLMDNDGANIWHALAENAFLEGKPLQADKYYDTAIYIYHLPYSYYLKGEHYMKSGKKELARKQFLKYQNHPFVRVDTSATNKAILKYIAQVMEEKK